MNVSNNNSNNRTGVEEIIFTHSTIFELSLNWSLSCIGIILNSIQLFLLYKQPFKSPNTILTSLALAELVFLVTKPSFLTLQVLRILSDQLRDFFTVCNSLNTILHLMVLTADRLIAVLLPFWHHVHATRQKTLAVCIMAWLVVFMLGFVAYVTNWMKGMGVILGLTILVTSVIYLLSYICIIRVSLSRGKMRRTDTLARHTPNPHLKTIWMSFLIVLSFIVINTPQVIACFMESPHCRIMTTLRLISCSVDSLIYFWVNKCK